MGRKYMPSRAVLICLQRMSSALVRMARKKASAPFLCANDGSILGDFAAGGSAGRRANRSVLPRTAA